MSATPQAAPVEANSAELTSIEDLALKLGRITNEGPVGKALQNAFLRTVGYTWIRAILAKRCFTEGLDRITKLDPDRGVLMASNHRTFFDQYGMLMSIWMGPTPWAQRLYFPVRSNFFYERPLGLAVNYLVGAGAMYPPIFRQTARAALNKDALERVSKFLSERGTLVGVHPEGTRGKGPDPYEMLPAQPGIGQIALHAKPIVIPCFINGLSNDFVSDVRSNFTSTVRRTNPVITIIGEPIDYSDLMAQKPRPALYKKAADRFRAAIIELMPRERELRNLATSGLLPDDHPGWLLNRDMGTVYARPR